MELSVGHVCDRGLSHKRPVNEDRALVLADAGLFVVCDGVGGHSSGEVASQLAIDTIEEALVHFEGGDVERLLHDAVRYANRDIYEMAAREPRYDGMGTTVALLYLDRDRRKAIVGHAGDSRVYRFDGARLYRETYDHTDLDDAIRSGRISAAQAHTLGKQNTINRALGIEPDVQAEFKTLDLADADAFLLCSDGVTRHLDDEELEELFADGLAPDAMCEEIRSRCYARGAEDNLTAIVVRFAESGVPAEAPGARRPIEFPAARRARVGTSARPTSSLAPLMALIALALGAVGFFAGRASVVWLAPKQAAPQPVAVARAAFEEGDFPRARAAFGSLAAGDPGRAEYQYWLGRSCLADNAPHEAVTHFEEAARLGGAPSDTLLFLAAAYQADAREKEAADAFRRFAETVRAPAALPAATAGAANASNRR